ncbi:unnamed protein product, partial [Chrysoparadoxa australica]
QGSEKNTLKLKEEFGKVAARLRSCEDMRTGLTQVQQKASQLEGQQAQGEADRRELERSLGTKISDLKGLVKALEERCNELEAKADESHESLLKSMRDAIQRLKAMILDPIKKPEMKGILKVTADMEHISTLRTYV